MVEPWLTSHGLERLVISDWTATEFSAALFMEVRMRHLAVPARADALAVFTSLVRDSFTVLPVASADFLVAARLADAREPRLCAGAALHLGIVPTTASGCCRSDHVQVKAALAAGIRARLF